MKKLLQFIFVFFVTFMLTSCWDSRPLRDITVLKSASLDLLENGSILITGSSPVPEKYHAEERVQIISAEGKTVRDARNGIDKKTSEIIDASKLRILVVGETFAREDIYPALDVLYRDPRSALAANIAIAKGSGTDIVKMRLKDKPRTSEFLADLLEAAEKQTLVPYVNIQLICPPLFDPGQDIIVPYIGATQGAPYLEGLALFSENSMVDTLNIEDSTMLLILKGLLGERAPFVERVHSDQPMKIEEFVSFHVKEMSREIDIEVDEHTQEITVPLTLELKIEVIEYPHDELHERETIVQLNEILSDHLTEKSVRILNKLQEINCDALGVGRRLIAFHHSVWDEETWRDVYPTITFEPDINVEIIRHGIIN
ncbi:Ger(x)C family spore germination protein [Evansella halocellulosilytica]|uniref:Ger(x)C family spore germination protein n=1 Tax=Evansella halocellulosilytica TaxID=2011013 RepID=UPI000BB698D7|nr:Ger(x)C family spore germination protein [Evansella halocellulosilytica]